MHKSETPDISHQHWKGPQPFLGPTADFYRCKVTCSQVMTHPGPQGQLWQCRDESPGLHTQLCALKTALPTSSNTSAVHPVGHFDDAPQPTELDQHLLHQSGSQKEQGSELAGQAGDERASFNRLLSSLFNESQRTSPGREHLTNKPSFPQTSALL